jgi:HK97 family phage prohead protease
MRARLLGLFEDRQPRFSLEAAFSRTTFLTPAVTLAAIGYATRYNQVVVKDGTPILLLPGVFSRSLKSKARVRLLLNHFDNQLLGSTSDILSLWDDDTTGLAFGFSTIPNNKHGKYLRYMAEDARFDSVSVGFDYVNAYKVIRTIDGTEVNCVASADLLEISIISGWDGGACKKSFVAYGNFDSLPNECCSGRLFREGAAVEFRRAVRRYEIAEFEETRSKRLRNDGT